MILRVLLAAALAGTSSLGQAENGVTYKGLSLGSSLEEFQTRFPDYRCSGMQCRYLHAECVRTDDTLGADQALVSRARQCEERNSFGGAPIQYAEATFRDGRLSRLLFSLPTRHAEALLAAAKERYGAPSAVSDEPFRTRGGGVFPNTTASWRSGSDVLRVSLNTGKLGEGSAMLSTQEELKRAEEDRKGRAKQGAADF